MRGRQTLRALALGLLLLASPALAEQVQEIVLGVLLNNQDKGSFIIHLDPAGQALIDREDFGRLGIDPNALPVQAEGRWLAPANWTGVEQSLDFEQGILYLHIPPHYLQRSEMATGGAPVQRVEPTPGNGFYTNYALTYAWDQTARDALNGSFELAGRMGRFLLFTSLNYYGSPAANKPWVRNLTQVVHDDPDSLRRWTVGDFSLFSGSLGSGGLYGGIKLEKTFVLDPLLRRYPGMGIGGMLENPATVEIYVNDVLVDKRELPAGPFNAASLPVMNGSGNVRLVIRDIFGREMIIDRPYYINTLMLKPGLDEYQLGIGYQRLNQGQSSNDYGDPALAGFYRRGLSNWLTAGIRGEADSGMINIGPTANLTLFGRGFLDLSTAWSHDGAGNGLGGQANFAIPYGRGTLSGSVRKFSGAYANLAPKTEGKKQLASDYSLTASWYAGALGSLTVTCGRLAYHDDEPGRTRLSLIYQRSLFRSGNLNLTLQRLRDDDGRVDNSVLLTLQFALDGGRRYVSFQGGSAQGRNASTLSLYRNMPYSLGNGYRLQLQYDEAASRSWLGYARIERNGRWLRSSLDYTDNGEQRSGLARVSGALAWLGGEVHLSRPINDAYALVRTGMPGVEVKLNGQLAGRTGKRGSLLVPGLINYSRNNLGIDLSELPLGYTLVDDTTEALAPYYRGGVVADFRIRAMRSVEGRLRWWQDGQFHAVEFAGLDISGGGIKRTTFTGYDGLFYFDNLPAGAYTLRMYKNDRECRAGIEVPAVDEPGLDLGEIDCGGKGSK